ncbi:hypothetical protein C8R46DRAFT_1112844 [Mycena filopes]|nr:hypothetical protein C8R46DRAFT_1112844 [Mycena filopes]
MNRLFLRLPQRGAPLKLISFVLISVLLVSAFSYRALSGGEGPDLEHVPYEPSPNTIALGHPTFEDIREYEHALPQHRLAVLAANPRPRYLFLPWEAWGTGWNNVFQEQLLNTHLGYLANRGYVFVDYIARDHPPFADTLPGGERHMLHIPMNALTSGPTGGGSWGPDAKPGVPLPVSQKWWASSCPDAEVVEVNVGDTVRELNITDSTQGDERLRLWGEKLLGIEAACVKIVGGSPFDYMFIGSDRVLSMWDSYGASPTLKQYAWSALITRALSRNFALVSPGPLPTALAPALSRIVTTPGAGSPDSPYLLTAFRPLPASAPPIRGLLGLHLRRGDYEEHCNNLAWWGSGFNAWNQFGDPSVRETKRFPALPDYLSLRSATNESRFDAAHRHCWPTPEEIVERVRAVRAEAHGQELRSVYMATNGKAEWVADVAAKLRADGWEMVSSSLDMKLAKDEFAVSQAVDMGVLVAAETFIGVGFSSLSSNVVQLRLAGGREPSTCRFW